MADSLRFQTNIPEVVALEYADGLAVSSKFSGDQVMFTLTDGRKMYLPPIVADKIAAAGIQAREAFGICKREFKQGNRRVVEYQIETATSGNVAASSAPAQSNAHQTSAVTPTPASYNGNAARAIHAVPAALPTWDELKNTPAAAPASVAAPSAVALMKMAGCGAIDAVLDVEKYAQARGMVDFSFGADNIQKIACCMFIEMCKKAGRS